MFYERFLTLCEEKRIKPSAAATQAGFNKGTVSVWKKRYLEGVDVRPEKDVIEKICQFFNCSEPWLLGIEGHEKKPTLISEGDCVVIGMQGFIYPSSSLWGTRPGISHTLIFHAFCLLFYPTVLHRIT